MAVLLSVNGVLLGVVLWSYALALPFLMAAFQYFITPPGWKTRRWLDMATLVVTALSLIFALSFLSQGFLAEGVALLALNVTVIALVVYPFFTRKTTPQPSRGQANS